MSNVSNSAPDSDPPAFYAMPEDTTRMPAFTEFGNVALVIPQHQTVIYGRKVACTDPEDADAIAGAESRGYIFGEWFSDLCPDGELGSNHISRLYPLTRAEFEAAREQGWPNYYNRETTEA